MYKILCTVILFTISITLCAQKTTTAPKHLPLLKTNADSVSYVMGEVVAFSLLEKQMGDVKIANKEAFFKGMKDKLDKIATLIDDASANALLNDYMQKLQADKSKPIIEEGKQFLAKNKLRPEVKTTTSGLQYEIITQGIGIKPTQLDSFVVNYRGTLLNGTEFDASYTRNEPLKMPVSRVIQGWIEGLQLMPEGSKYKFWIPYDLGYGLTGNGKIPGGAMLIFELELLKVIKGN